MKLCSIVPIKQKEWMNDRPYNMLLAHLAKTDRSYARWASVNKSYKIMDNSIIELGKAFSLTDLLKEASVCNVQEIILPDVFQDGPATIELAKKSYNEICNSPYRGRFKLMVVCHGKNEKEVIDSFTKIEALPFVDTIGMPKVIGSWGDRNDYKELYKKSKKKIHYLGCWYSFKEIIEMDNELKARVRTVDTCLPSLLALQGKKWDEDRDLSYTVDLIHDNIPKKAYKQILSDFTKNTGVE